MMPPMDRTDDLRLLLASRHPLIVASMDDEERFMGFLRGAALAAGYPVWTWSVTRGLARDGFDPQVGTLDPRKTLARTWDVPLVLLDPGRLYGAFVGESESRLAESLATVDAMAPVVLWIDEIEKRFAAGTTGGDSGV